VDKSELPEWPRGARRVRPSVGPSAPSLLID
jgi:hypothetical protein